MAMIERGYTWTEEYRHQCEAEYVAGQDHEWRHRFFAGVKEKRGEEACGKLYMDAKREYQKNKRMRQQARQASLER